MKFKWESRVYNLNSNYPDPLYEYLKPFSIEEKHGLYIDITDVSKIKSILDNISENLYDGYGWKPDEVLIDFDYNTITLRDSYIE